MKSIFAVLLMGVLGLGNVAATGDGPVVGIGVGIHAANHQLVVDQVLPGNAAFKGGVKVGDQLLKVDGKSVDGLSARQTADLLRGAAGTKVKITVQRPGEKSTRHFSLRRQLVTLPGSPAPASAP